MQLKRIIVGIRSLSRKQRKNEIILDLIWAVKEIQKLRNEIDELRRRQSEIRSGDSQNCTLKKTPGTDDPGTVLR